jgi:hypothetical protein
MPLKKFGPNDIFHNQLEVYPQVQFDIYSGVVYYQNRSIISGAFTPSTPNVPTGFVSLYEMNVDRNASETGLIYPFVVKNGSLSNFRSISTDSFMSDFQYGDILTGSYPLSASISRNYYPMNSSRSYVGALQNTLNYYKYLSKHYAFSSDLGDKGTERVNLISIPSIIYGSSIKKGTVDLTFYVSGTLIGRLQDTARNGELIETSGSNTGSVAGVVLYNEGFILLTGSWDLEAPGITRDYLNSSPINVPSSWLYYGVGISMGHNSTLPFVNYRMQFSGSNTIPTVTMLAHANKGELNYSSNPTFLAYGSTPNSITGTYTFFKEDPREIKNTVLSPYADPTASFQKITYISKIGIYDEDENLIGVATVATPVKKTLDRNLTFKLKLDF